MPDINDFTDEQQAEHSAPAEESAQQDLDAGAVFDGAELPHDELADADESGAHEPGGFAPEQAVNPEEHPGEEQHYAADAGEEAPAAIEGEQPAEEAAPVEEEVDDGFNWYIIHAYSGFENKVAESLKTRSQAFGFDDKIGQILIPTEDVVELRNGKKVTTKRLLYPGYVLVQLKMDDALWHEIKNTPRVTGFVGGGNSPVPLTKEEVNGIINRQAVSAERPRPKLTFEKNETVRIVDGPFTNFTGKVDEINSERNTLRVMVTIFGRSTPVELEFLQVEKV